MKVELKVTLTSAVIFLLNAHRYPSLLSRSTTLLVKLYWHARKKARPATAMVSTQLPTAARRAQAKGLCFCTEKRALKSSQASVHSSARWHSAAAA
jgi:hypothetical protein